MQIKKIDICHIGHGCTLDGNCIDTDPNNPNRPTRVDSILKRHNDNNQNGELDDWNSFIYILILTL